jgi:hypothetical protein
MNGWWSSIESPRDETWGAFMKYALAQGVTVGFVEAQDFDGETYGPFHVLHHTVNGETFSAIMPKNCSADRRLRFGRLAVLCKQLRIKEPNWPVTF